MQILIFIFSFFVFLYTLYKLVKDDHVFLRKNIKIEQIFDISFIAAAIGLICSQLVSPKGNSSLTFFALGSFLSLFLIAKYRKFPMGRFLDFFTLSFLTALPAVYILESIFFKKIELIISLISALVYLFLAVFFKRVLLKRVMSRTLKEGRLSIYFAIFFSVLSFSTGITRTIIEHGGLLSIENIILIGMFIASLVLLFIRSRD